MARSVSARVTQTVLELVVVLGILVPGGWAQAITFVQINEAVPQTNQSSVSVTYTGAQTAGNTNVIAIGWNDNTSSVTSVTDTNGNAYTLAVGPTLSPTQSQVIYVGRNIAAAAAGANSVTVNFNAAASFPDVRILEYAGLDPASPIDTTAATVGSGTTSSSGPLTTSFPYDLIFAANYVTTNTDNSGDGFVDRVITNPDGDIAEDQTVTATGTYTATASIRDGSFVMQAVALRGAASGPPSPGDPSVVGQWSSVTSWPILPIHVTLMPTGKVLAYGHDATNNTTLATVWDPNTNTFQNTSFAGADLFCSGHGLLPDGRVFIAGGHNLADYHGIANATIFDPTTSTWSSAPAMSFARWYPTVTALPDGRMLVSSGAINCDGCNATIPEIYDPTANSWTQLSNAALTIPIYPHMFVLPDGRVLNTGSYELPIPTRALNISTQTWTTIDPTVLDAGSAVMYVPGKFLKTGTSATSDPPYQNSAATAYVLDMTQGSPAWQAINPMAFARTYHNLTVLPDGNVVVTGGIGNTNPDDQTLAVYAAEMWSPTTQNFTTMASMVTPRVYHSTALLLPDGRVLVGGGGEYQGTSPDQLNAEIYSPPYLFNGARPTVTSAPSTLGYGSQFAVQTPDAVNISSVALLRLGSVTHAFNENQRYVPLTFTSSAGSLNVTAPANANLAPPGHYMLFLVNSNGVPSVATFVQMVTSGTAPAPAVTSITPNSGTINGGTPVTITGTNFLAGATVKIGGNAATGVTVVSSTSITATTPAHSAGAGTVVVTNSDGQSGTLTNGFTYIVTNPAPTVTSITPNFGNPNGGTAVTITGTGFLTGATVTFGGTAATGVTVVSGTSITATAPAHAAGTVTVAVTNTDNQTGGLNNGYNYTTVNPAPTVTAITPNSGTTNGGTPVTITGTNFLTGATVRVGGGTATGVTVVSSTSITANTPSHSAGPGTVVVVNTDGQSGSLTNGFTYVVINSAPTVTSITPNSGTINGGTAVTITGTGFLAGATVNLGGTAATAVKVVSTTSITATTAPHAVGPVSVVITNTDGQSGTLVNGYAYTNPGPTVTSITPNSGTANGGTGVTIAGTGFLAGATVSFGGTAATAVTVTSSTSIGATTPAHAGGSVSVTVTNTDSQSGTLANGYTYTSSLGLLSAGSASATVAAGQTATYNLSIGGAGLSGMASLSCSGAPLGAACSVPTSQPFNSTTTTAFNVTVTTTSRTIAALHPPASSHVPWSWTLAMTMLGIVFMPGIRACKRSTRRYLWLAPVALTLFLASCGGGGSIGGGPTGGTQSNPNGTPAGTYNLSLTASMNSGATTQTVPLTLIVK